MNGYLKTLPSTNGGLRGALYEGALYHVGATDASRTLVDETWGLLTDEFGDKDPRHVKPEIGEVAFFEAVGRIRKTLYEDPHFHGRVFQLIEALGYDPAEVAFDPVRLRVVDHKGHENPRAAPIYYAHRDTWFSLSQSVVAWWVAVHDVPATETFEIYPDWFGKAVDNDSEGFDYDGWAADQRSLKIGWQDRDAGRSAHYCGAGEFEPGAVVSLNANRGDNVLFSGHHLHRTLGHEAGYTRFSLDLRMVHLGDHQNGRGPENVDNRSTGSATRDYVRR